MNGRIKAKGRWIVEIHDVDGTLLWREEFSNGITTAGFNDLLSVYFDGGTQKPDWYAGLIDSAGFSTLSSADTIASHAGWAEATAYDEAIRQTWTPGSISGGVISNPTPMVFTASGTTTVKGAFIVSESTVGGTTGQLWSTGLFSSAQILAAGQTISLTYTLTLAA